MFTLLFIIDVALFVITLFFPSLLYKETKDKWYPIDDKFEEAAGTRLVVALGTFAAGFVLAVFSYAELTHQLPWQI